MVAALKAGRTADDVAAEHGVCKAVVIQSVRAHRPPTGWPFAQVPPSDRNEAMVAAFMEGQTFTAIAKKHSLSVGRAVQIIDQAVRRARDSVDGPVPDSAERARDYRRVILAYAAERHAADPGMRARRALELAEERQRANRERSEQRKAMKAANPWRIDDWMRQ
jgi:hypothetical protein